MPKGVYKRSEQQLMRFKANRHIFPKENTYRFKKGHKTWNKGVTHSDKTKEKLSLLKQGSWTGNKNPKWKGGINYWNLKERVFKRDDYTCQVCGLKDYEVMQPDHIKPKSLFPELKLEMSNLWTLCSNCHMRKTKRERKYIVRLKKRMNSEELQSIDWKTLSLANG